MTETRIRRFALVALDYLVMIFAWLVSPPFRCFVRCGPRDMPRSREMFRRLGYFPVPDHYYWPMFNDKHISADLSKPRDLPGVDLRHSEQVQLVEQFDRREELDGLVTTRPDISFNSPNFGRADSEFLYSFVRHFKPRRIFEIGSGYSTMIAREAAKQNAAEVGYEAEHICIEPYEMLWLEESGVRVIRQRVEEVGLDIFRTLSKDDLLFIDSSHVIRPQGDVLFEYLNLLPTLEPGVLIHIHDIFTPFDYPERWLREDVRMWNEQYLVEAILGTSSRYEVVAGLSYLSVAAPEVLRRACPGLRAEHRPGSFYLRVIG